MDVDIAPAKKPARALSMEEENVKLLLLGASCPGELILASWINLLEPLSSESEYVFVC